MDKHNQEPKLSLKQKLFCRYYVENFGNGTEAVINAGYSVKEKGVINRDVAKSIASENLTKPYLRNYIEQLINENGLNDNHVNLKLLSLIDQEENLPVKIKAIETYYKLTHKFEIKDDSENYRRAEIDEMFDRIAKILP